MRIVLTKDVSARKGWMTGRAFDWPRPVISNISRHRGSDDWWEPEESFQQRVNASSVRKPRRKKADA